MAIPRRGDPRRPLFLAASSCRVLGVLAVLSGTCAGFGLFAAGRRGSGGSFAAALMLGLNLVVSVAFFVVAAFLKRRQPWAVVTGLVLTGLVSVAVAISVIGTAAMVIAMPGSPPQGALVAGGVELLILVALAQLIYHLARSFEAIRYAPPGESRGFEVLPVEPLADDPV